MGRSELKKAMAGSQLVWMESRLEYPSINDAKNDEAMFYNFAVRILAVFYGSFVDTLAPQRRRTNIVVTHGLFDFP